MKNLIYSQDVANSKGFTLLEIMIVIALLGIIASFLLYGFQNFARFQQYNQAVSDIEFVLRQVRLDARSAVDDEVHGIKFNSDNVVRFAGTPYDALDPDNIVMSYQHVTFLPVLSGGADEVIFDRLTGLPSATGTILIEGIHYEASTTVELNDVGVIQ